MGETKFTSSRTFIVLMHVLAWLIVFAIPILISEFENEHPEHPGPPEHQEHGPIIRPTHVVYQLSMVALFYFNAFFTVPGIMYKRGFFQYFLASLFSIFVVACMVFGINKLLPAGHPRSFQYILVYIFFQSLFVLAISTSYTMFRDRNKAERLLKEKENEGLKTELSFLRSQVSPHFMFNVLNNIVSLSRKRSEMVEPVVIKLSHLMRYMLYESDEEKVSLDKEVDYLQSYIDLQMLRFGDDVKLKLDVGNKNAGASIEPMLLIPFVENAFKHGVVLISDPQIEIHLQSSGHELSFIVKNKFNVKVKEEKDKSSGIGLNNVKRRLNLLYKGKHRLSVRQEGDWFIADLQLQLK
jgi:two-component system LytT family sensor kinase